MTKRSVFVSKNAEELKAFADYCTKQKTLLHAESLLEFKETKIKSVPEDYQVVFFSSPRCVDFFFRQPLASPVKFACIGQSTENKLKEYAYSADFVGTNSSNPRMVFQQFATWLDHRKVLIPHGNKSKLGLLRFIPKESAYSFEVYQTLLKKTIIPKSGIYAFSSPSNVEAFFLSGNTLPGNSKIISWGKTTSKALKNKNISPDAELKFGLEKELINIVSKL